MKIYFYRFNITIIFSFGFCLLFQSCSSTVLSHDKHVGSTNIKTNMPSPFVKFNENEVKVSLNMAIIDNKPFKGTTSTYNDNGINIIPTFQKNLAIIPTNESAELSYNHIVLSNFLISGNILMGKINNKYVFERQIGIGYVYQHQKINDSLFSTFDISFGQKYLAVESDYTEVITTESSSFMFPDTSINSNMSNEVVNTSEYYSFYSVGINIFLKRIFTPFIAFRFENLATNYELGADSYYWSFIPGVKYHFNDIYRLNIYLHAYSNLKNSSTYNFSSGLSFSLALKSNWLQNILE